jgi:hypothetical protein
VTNLDWAKETVAKMADKDPALCALALYSAGWRCADFDERGYQLLRLSHRTRSGRGVVFVNCTMSVFNLMEEIQRGHADD